MKSVPCPACRRRKAVEGEPGRDGGREKHQRLTLFRSTNLDFLDRCLFHRRIQIASQVVKEIRERLGFLVSVGLEYLTLSRASATLSGGESQRIRLATQSGSSLMGVIYILDEPSIGLHQRDNRRLLATLKKLRDLGNTLIVVEHDEETIEAADYILDIGPGAGIHGGEVVAAAASWTSRKKPIHHGRYLSGRFHHRAREKEEGKRELARSGAPPRTSEAYRRGIPVGTFPASPVFRLGKSSLRNDILYMRLSAELTAPTSSREAGRFLARVFRQDHRHRPVPIGRTPRPTGTYTGFSTYP
jgi:excinuclease ABC subunit A